MTYCIVENLREAPKKKKILEVVSLIRSQDIRSI